jgi:hypothetical protein
MTDAHNLITEYERHRKTLAESSLLNKTAVFEALAAGGITSVTVEFDGEGDSGQIEAITACSGEARVELPATRVRLLRASWNVSTPTYTETALCQAIEGLCYDYLEQEHGGWENNDGAFGTFEFDVGKCTVSLEFNGRFTDIATDHHNF